MKDSTKQKIEAIFEQHAQQIAWELRGILTQAVSEEIASALAALAVPERKLVVPADAARLRKEEKARRIVDLMAKEADEGLMPGPGPKLRGKKVLAVLRFVRNNGPSTVAFVAQKLGFKNTMVSSALRRAAKAKCVAFDHKEGTWKALLPFKKED